MSIEQSSELFQTVSTQHWSEKLTAEARKRRIDLQQQYFPDLMINGYREVDELFPIKIKIVGSSTKSPREVRSGVIEQGLEALRGQRLRHMKGAHFSDEFAVAEGAILPPPNWETLDTIGPEQLIFQAEGISLYVRSGDEIQRQKAS